MLYMWVFFPFDRVVCVCEFSLVIYDEVLTSLGGDLLWQNGFISLCIFLCVLYVKSFISGKKFLSPLM